MRAVGLHPEARRHFDGLGQAPGSRVLLKDFGDGDRGLSL